MKVLFIFLDGVGLGANDPETNPLARASMPNLEHLLGGRRLLAQSAPCESDHASLLALDACLGIDGIPQSATGQAVLLTGRNVPAEMGEHYGPKPNPPIAEIIRADNLFKRMVAAGRASALLNAYPPRYFHGVDTGRRLYSAIPLAVTSAGIPLFTQDDFYAGQAMSADFTGEGWRSMLGFSDAPVLSAHDAGRKLVELALRFDFSMFEYWASDYAGHEQDMAAAVRLMESFDGVMGGLLESLTGDLRVLVSSDHGNMEDLSTRRHTTVPVPGLVLGPHRTAFTDGLRDLTAVPGKILDEVMRTA